MSRFWEPHPLTSDDVVYVTEKIAAGVLLPHQGKYHLSPDCGHLRAHRDTTPPPRQVTESWALEAGVGPCTYCFPQVKREIEANRDAAFRAGVWSER